MAGERPTLNPSHVAELPFRLKQEVNQLLTATWADQTKTQTVSFTMPAESHVMPLFGNEVFKQLVHLHNAHRYPHLFVSPLTLMTFDSEIDTYAKTVKGGIPIHGEGIIPHEHKHFWEYESLFGVGEKPAKPAQIQLSFFWEKCGDVYELNCSGDHLTADGIPEPRYRSVYIAPQNPSITDLKKYYKSFVTLNPMKWKQHVQMATAATRMTYSNEDIDPEFFHMWLHKNRHTIDSKQFLGSILRY
ncbi:MAG: hypothetical protein WA061_04845 [Microgenomates group bacterium]